MSRNDVFAISKNKLGEVTLKGFNYLQSTLRAWYDDLKEKLLEDYHSGRYTILPEWEGECL